MWERYVLLWFRGAAVGSIRLAPLENGVDQRLPLVFQCLREGPLGKGGVLFQVFGRGILGRKSVGNTLALPTFKVVR